MRLLQKVILFFCLTILSFSTIFLVLLGVVRADGAGQLNLSNESINPGSLYYPLKRVLEKGQEVLSLSSDSKRSFHKTLLKKRLTELNFVVNEKRLSEVEKSSERFAYQAGVLTEDLVKQNNSGEKQKTIKEFEQYNNLLATLRDKFRANSSFWMLVQHDINALNILVDRLK